MVLDGYLAACLLSIKHGVVVSDGSGWISCCMFVEHKAWCCCKCFCLLSFELMLKVMGSIFIKIDDQCAWQ